jgi:RHS repeat-associated protein
VATFFYAWDHLGTVRLASNQDRSVVERHDYEPFGVELRPILNQTQNTHQFTGHERDQASGYDYMHFRYYGSTMGRFLKPDTILGNLGNPQSWNLYSYVHGNPVNFNDPTGHEAMEDWGSTFSPDNATPASWDGGQMFSFGLGLGEGLGTVGGDSARRLNDLFKSIEPAPSVVPHLTLREPNLGASVRAAARGTTVAAMPTWKIPEYLKRFDVLPPAVISASQVEGHVRSNIAVPSQSFGRYLLPGKGDVVDASGREGGYYVTADQSIFSITGDPQGRLWLAIEPGLSSGTPMPIYDAQPNVVYPTAIVAPLAPGSIFIGPYTGNY